MRKVLTAGLAALALGGSVAATATSAEAQRGNWHGSVGHAGGSWHGGSGWHGGDRGGWRGGRDDDDDWGWSLGAGLAGFALGATLADRPYYNGYYDYGPGYYYYGPGYYDYGDRTCVGHRRVWDPYYGGYVIRRFYYDC